MTDKIEKTIELAAPVARVWRALTDYREFGQWFRVALEGPFEVGKVTRGQMTYPGYEQVKWEVLVERMDHERLFSFSWQPQDIDPDTDHKMLVEFRLEPMAEGTRLFLTESGFDALPNPQRLEALRRNTRGWSEQMENITAHVTS